MAFPVGTVVAFLCAFPVSAMSARCSWQAVQSVIFGDPLLLVLAGLAFVLLVATVVFPTGKWLTILLIVLIVVVPVAFSYRLMADIASEQVIANRLRDLSLRRIAPAVGSLHRRDAHFPSEARAVFSELLGAIRAASSTQDGDPYPFLGALRHVCSQYVSQTLPPSATSVGQNSVELRDLASRFILAAYDEAIQGCARPRARASAIEDCGAAVSALLGETATRGPRGPDGWLSGCRPAVDALRCLRQQAASDSWGDSELGAIFAGLRVIDHNIAQDGPERSTLIDEALQLAWTAAKREPASAVAKDCLQFVADRLDVETWREERTISIIEEIEAMGLAQRQAVGTATPRPAEGVLCYIMDLSAAAGEKRCASRARTALQRMDSQLVAEPRARRPPPTADLGPYLEWLARSLARYKSARAKLDWQKQTESPTYFLRYMASAVRERERLLRIGNAHAVPYEAEVLHTAYLSMLTRGVEALDALRAGDDVKFSSLSSANSLTFAAVCQAYEDIQTRPGGAVPLPFYWRHLATQ